MDRSVLPGGTPAWVAEVWPRIELKMAAVRERNADKIPYTTSGGVYDDRSKVCPDWNENMCINWWTNGFWGGVLWLMYQRTGDARYMEVARASEEKLDACFDQFLGLHHDVGFMWMPTAVADYRLTRNQDGYRRGMHAANILAGRFNIAAQYIRAWNQNEMGETLGWAIIDCMMNLSLLYWASEQTGDPRFRQIAEAHANTAMKSFVRDDGSVRHIVEFDPYKGGFVRDFGGQGYAQGSSWTRGQAWGIYGFMISYMHTGNKEYLDTARKIADNFISRTPESKLVPIDFDQPAEPVLEDSTAAAIASCGILELASSLKDSDAEGSVRYAASALEMLDVLCRERCCFDADKDGILQECGESYHGDNRHHMHIIYGDYYLIEALLKISSDSVFLW